MHGYAHGEIGGVYDFGVETFAFGAYNESQTLSLSQSRVVKSCVVTAKCECGRLQSELMQSRDSIVALDVGPGHKENASHRHAYASTVEGIARPGGEQYGIHTQGGGAAEYCSGIGGVADAVDDGDSSCAATYFGIAARCGTAHGAQHPACQSVACQGGQGVAVAGIHGSVPG